ncbi:hypothetical protein JTE90_014407 [Oedothorax gibbosus]|uniref:Fatty acid synthase n=1 Tax=Oedothorax gibbosus TaxID=931172 RepID=A0AAV6UFN3_9ARAC|nr:hypothetical protein JTE90_014407 [Oedothorax gibbosus]
MDPSSDRHEYCTGGFDPDDIVVSGIAGRFPDCESVGELQEGLYEKKTFIRFTDDRYEKGCKNMPYSSCGCVKNLDKFDADFFCITQKNSNLMDPSVRRHLEVCYEAIADAGYDPNDVKGLRIGMYNATTNDDGPGLRTRCSSNKSQQFTLNSIRAMTPNRASYSLDLKGPSYTIDAACSSSAIALWTALNDIRDGRTEAALVSGVQLNLSPEYTEGYLVSGIISRSGHSKPFDADTDGMLRTEAITAVFIQKARTARRAYASVTVSRFYTAGYVPEGISVPSGPMETQIMKDVLEEAKVRPDEIQYVEAHGTGTQVGDPIEINSLDTAFCEGRTEPLLVGTIKSNIGHTEACSAICGMIKAIFAFENGVVAPNINFDQPNPNAHALVEGRIRIVTEPTPLSSIYIPVNSFGFGGTLCVSLLKQNPITYEGRQMTQGGLPRLILYPATTEVAVQHVFDYIKNNFQKLHEEFYTLLYNLSFTPLLLKPIRGYSVFTEDGENTTPQIKTVVTTKRPLWYVMTGMGCQWSGMGLQFMEIEVFAQSMKRSAAVLKPYGIDLFEILRADKNYLQVDRNITPAFVTISAIQMALVDLLTFLGLSPDGMVGHSTGELICAYADGCCTLEETILSAYWRGKAVESANLPSGAMAAVGLSWMEAQKLCPKGIFPACDNADDSVTISGLKEPLEKFVVQLMEEKIFARVVNAYGYAFHCECVHPAASALREALSKLIKNPKPRTNRWLSTCYPESEWDTPSCKTADADYFVHNLMSNVLFNDALKKIPSDAIVVEIGPHFLLQSILKRVIGKDASYIGLMKRNEPNNIRFLMESLGKLYTEGLDVRVDRLYPAVKFPVPRGTPFISDLLKWDHSQSYFVPKFLPTSSEYSKDVFVEKEDAYLLDHRIDGRSLFPATGYVYLAWEALATKMSKNLLETSVVVENLKIHRATILGQVPSTTFFVNILESTGHFEISEGKALVASGYVSECKTMNFESPDIPTYSYDDYNTVSGKDIYNELKMQGYEYGPEFQGLLESNMDGSTGLVLWKDKWISYMDSLLLFFGLINKGKEFFLPTGALSFKIDPIGLKNYVQKTSESANGADSQNFPAIYNPNTRICRSVGIEISNLSVDAAPLRGKDDAPTLEQYMFVPYVSKYLPTDSSKALFNEYMAVLNELVDKVGKTNGKGISQFKFPVDGKKLDKEELDNLVDNPSEEHVLYSVLRKFEKTSNGVNRSKEYFTSYLRESGKDLLNSALLNEETLRKLFEIVAENTHRKLNVVEIARDFPSILINLTEMLHKYSLIKFKKSTLVTSKKSFEVDKEILAEHDIQLQTAENALPDMEKEKSQDVAISSFITGSTSELRNLLNSLISIVKSQGFILFFHKESISPAERFLCYISGEELEVQSSATLGQFLQNIGLTVLSKVSDSFGCSAYLLRAILPPSPNSIVYVEESRYDWVEELKKEMYGRGGENKNYLIWVIAQDSPTNGIIGMVNCLKQEPGGEKIRCLFISEKERNSKVPPFRVDHPFYKHLQEKSLVMNVWREGEWGSFRHVPTKTDKQMKLVDHSYIHCRKYGDLSTFEWIESQVKYAEAKDKKLVHIYYSALNFKDVMLATGKLSVGTSKDTTQGDESVLGLEFSGRDSTGTRVCGFVSSRGMATSTNVDPHHLISVPDSWTLEEAATVPVVYATCYYALIVRGKLSHGERVLIHSGTGGIGQAAIRIALSLNCEIFTTVGNEEKRKYLKKIFPQIKDENIGCSRNVSFYGMVMNGTNGEGADVVLNSLADDKFQASLRCVGRSGRFVEIGKYDLSLDRQIGLKMFLQNISLHAVFLDQLFEKTPATARYLAEIMSLINDGINTGVVKPLDRTVFGRNDIEDAFRYMAKGVHVGKVLLKIRDEEPSRTAIPKTLMLPAVPNTYFYSKKVYIIIGGIGGFGIEVTKWIISRGGRRIILTSRYGERTPYHYLCLRRWKKEGVDVHVSTLNVEHREEAEKLLKEAEKMGRVGGIFNSAVVLKDAFMDCQTSDNYHEVCAPKAIGSKNLDELSRKLCPALDCFVCFSSISCGRGNAGQTNYGFANSVMERICEERSRDGLHGLAVQWGIIGEVGVVHRHMGDDAMIAGVMAQSVKSCLDTLDVFCQQSAPVVTSYVTAAAVKKSGQGDTMAQIAKILGLNDISEINANRSFSEMGIDSMVGVELKQLIESFTGIPITMQEIQDLKINDVKALFAKADSEATHSSAPALMATSTIKLPSTLTHTEPLVLLNKSASGTPIFIVNIGDTDVKEFEILAQTIGRSVYALVWTKEAPTTDVKSIASWGLKLIAKTISGPFHVIGHSLGGSVAFEMALQSERTDKNLQTITLMNGSTNLSDSLNREDSDETDPEIGALCSFVSQFVASKGNTRLEEELEKSSSQEQRIKSVVNFLSSSSIQTVNKSDLADAISTYLVKYVTVQSYAPIGKLTKDINLIEDPTVVLANDVTIIKEQFEQVCKGKVNIHRVFSYSQLSNKEDIERLAAVLQSII